MYLVVIENQWTGERAESYGPYSLLEAERIAADMRLIVRGNEEVRVIPAKG